MAMLKQQTNGFKTRNFDNILSEVQQFFEIHKQIGTYAGGVHFEMTGKDVTNVLVVVSPISIQLNLQIVMIHYVIHALMVVNH